MKEVDDELVYFVSTLIASIPRRKLKDNNLHVLDPKTGKDVGTLKEYIVERVKTLLGVELRFD